MNIEYLMNHDTLTNLLLKAETELLSSVKKYKFEKSKLWRNNVIPNEPGVYALFDGEENLLYIGETGNLRERMNELNRTVNHSFRKQLGSTRFSGSKSRKKFSDEIELKLDEYFKENLHISFIEVNFGRLEIETFIIDKHQLLLLNSVKKRKSTIKQTSLNMSEVIEGKNKLNSIVKSS